MNVLVVVGSKHGATREIATAIADQLKRSGHHATTADAQSPPENLEPYDALLMGSAIYMGHWTTDARNFIDHNATLLATMPIWPSPADHSVNLQGPQNPTLKWRSTSSFSNQGSRDLFRSSRQV
jgi:menaquinone-dependent protoporphyrinogen IX oxidase